MNYKPMHLIDRLEQMILEKLGETAFIDAIQRALDYETKQDIYEYIARCYDLEVEEYYED